MRVRQQEILGELGVLALKGVPFEELLGETARLTAAGLGAEFCKVMEYLPGEKCFLVRTGVGWGNDIIGKARLGADLESPAGFALRTGKAVISNHLENEERFRTPELLVRYGIRRAINVILQGDGSPFGVLEADARTEGDFTQDDISFLQGAANMLGMAIERQRNERRLQAAIERQELLLKEIHHRVKNSLQIVASMLNLHANQGGNEEVRRELREASNRVLAIARAHESLYKNHEIGSLDIGAYLRDVCRDLGASAPGCIVRGDAPEGIRVATDRGISIALIAIELVTNAAKYAYPGDAKGTIRVILEKQEPDLLSLKVIDEGVGLPQDFELEKTPGLGMRIVMALAQSLNAKLFAKVRDQGSEFELRIPLRSIAPAS
ncbi:MAG: GAF domain-containing protein [Methylocapsa sp.]|nr:GAF domain-containing protein [Methylocapsa sp.]